MSGFVMEKEYVNVSVDFIENHLKDANGAYVKVYLYILNLAVKRKYMSCAEIAKELNLTESDILNAMDYWKETGVIEEVQGNIVIKDGKKKLLENVAGPEETTVKPAYDSMQIAEKVSKDAALSDMMGISQEIFGRILTAAEMESIFWIYDELKFSPEAILLLIEYCVSKGKANMKYIEKVAMAWGEKGAREADSVYEIIQAEEQKNGYLYSVRKVIGILDRGLSQSEEQYLIKWKNECGMNEDMVALAYDYCMLQTAKLSFPYMDRIIERWHKEGIHDVASAEEDNKMFKERKISDIRRTPDYNDLESLTRGRIKDE